MCVGVRRVGALRGEMKGWWRLCTQAQGLLLAAQTPQLAVVLGAAAATRKLSDPLPTGVFFRIPEHHKTIQGKTCCTALVLIMFCLTAVLAPETVTLPLLRFFQNTGKQFLSDSYFLPSLAL